MSPLELFIIMGAVGAAAFFFAGLLLRPRRGLPAADERPQTEPPDTVLREQLAAELMTARSQRATAEQKLVEVRVEQQQREEERKRETEKFISGERDRERLRSELEQRKRETERFALTGRERDQLLAELEEERKRDTEKYSANQRELDLLRSELEKIKEHELAMQERLRVAEDENRSAFEREEKAAVAFHQRLAGLANERKAQEATWHKQTEELRALLAQQTNENQRLQQERQTVVARESALRQEVERLRGIQQVAAQEKQRAQEAARAAELHEELALEQAAQEQNRIQTALQAAEKRQAEMLARLEQMEAHRNQMGAAEESLRSQQARWQSDMERLAHEITERQTEAAQLREQNRTLTLAAGTSHDELVKARAQAEELGWSLRAAEARLADHERLAQELAELRAEHAQAEQSQQDQQGEAKDAKVQLAAAQAKLAELDRVLEENRRLRDQVEELRANQDASQELDRLNAEYKRLRLDAELMARRLQELLQEQGEMSSLRAQAADALSLNEEVEYLRRREKDLEAQLYSCGFRISRDMPAVVDVPAPASPMGTMESNLHSLVGAPGPRTAVLADTQGFLIASAGESWVEEGLAAFAAVAADTVARTQRLLPLTNVESIRLTDANHTVLTCRLFESEGHGVGVATLGSDEPPPEKAGQAIVGLATILSTKT